MSTLQGDTWSRFSWYTTQQQRIPRDNVYAGHLKSQHRFSKISNLAQFLLPAFYESTVKNPLELMKILCKWKPREDIPFQYSGRKDAFPILFWKKSSFYFPYCILQSKCHASKWNFYVAFQNLGILFRFRTKPVCEIQNRKSAFHEALPATNHCQNLGKFIWLLQLDPVFTGHGTKALDPSAIVFEDIHSGGELFDLHFSLKI